MAYLKEILSMLFLKKMYLEMKTYSQDRFVRVLKSTKGSGVKYKAFFVVGGHRARFKLYMVHTTQTIQPSSIRLFKYRSSWLLPPATMNFDIWALDVIQAYLQSTEDLSRDVFLNVLHF